MNTRPRFALQSAALLLIVLTTSGCASKYVVSPASPAPRVSLTPLSTSVLQIDSRSSEDYLKRQSDFTKKVDKLSSGGTAK